MYQLIRSHKAFLRHPFNIIRMHLLNLPMERIGLSYLGKKKDSGVGVYEQETTTLHMTNPCLVMDTSLFYLFHIQIYLGGLHMLAADQKQ